MTHALYYDDAYTRQFTATVTAHDVERNGVYLSATAFYPGGGGQPADVGTLIDGARRYNVIAGGKGHLHILEGELPPIGAQIEGEIDWEHRYQLMRIHTAMHVLCGVAFHDYDALATGSNMTSQQGRIDFEFERLQRELVDVVEDRINTEAQKGYPVQTRFLARDEISRIPELTRTKTNILPEGLEQIRTVEIVGLDMQTCGGTHLANTSEIGTIRIAKYKSKGGINKRLYIEVES